MTERAIRATLAAGEAMIRWPRGTKRGTVMALDAGLIILTCLMAFWIRLSTVFFDVRPALIVIAAALFLWLPIFSRHGIYRTLFRFAGAGHLSRLVIAGLAYAVPMILIFMVVSVVSVPRTVGVLQPILFIGALCLSRIVARYILVDLLSQRAFVGARRDVAIFGAGNAGQQLAASLRAEPSMSLRAFIDDDRRLDGQTMEGVPIFHTDRIEDVIERHGIDRVLIAVPSLSRSRKREIIEALEPYPVDLRILPNLRQIVDGKVDLGTLQKVSVTDLLGREPVPPNEVLLARSIQGKTVLVTGAGGSIGSELCRQAARLRPKKLVLAEFSEIALYTLEKELREAKDAGELTGDLEIVPCMANVLSTTDMRVLYDEHRPETVFHAAAYKHVPLVEENVTAGVRNNVFGTLNAAQLAQEFGAERFILVSTDKAVRPTNIMGASKRICEMVLQALSNEPGNTRFAMVRFGNVLGSSGSVVPLFEQQIAAGGPVTLTHRDVTRYFMTIPEAAQLVIQSGAMAEGGEVYLLDMGEPVRIGELAELMISLSGRTVRSAENPDGDIEIQEVGLRPGEKLYEELLIDADAERTRHASIRRANEVFLPWAALSEELGTLDALIREGDDRRTRALVLKLVPEFMQPTVSVKPAVS
jgi:FlaA1/EpsC-like NDP-sugar epimerase